MNVVNFDFGSLAQLILTLTNSLKPKLLRQ